MVDPRYFAPVDLGQAYARGLAIREHREGQQDKQRLRELLPVAMGRGGISEDGAMSQDDAISQLYAVDHEIAMKLDEHQRAVAKEVTSDLANAVRWADTPDKWAEVQQFYKTKGVDLSQYGFEGRERGLMALGKLGEYLDGGPKANAPSSVQEYQFARSQGFKGSYMDFMDDKRGPLVANNGDGTFTLIPRGMAGNSPQPSANPPAPPPPGFVIDGEGGQTASAPSGNFPGAGN